MQTKRMQSWRGSRLLLAILGLALAGVLAHSLPDTTRHTLAAVAAGLMAGPTDLDPADTAFRAALEPQAVAPGGQL